MSVDGTPNIPPSDSAPNIPPVDSPPLTLRGYPPLTEADLEALTRALATARRMEEKRAVIERELAKEGFLEAASTAAYVCQNRALELKPWEWPVCWLKTANPDALLLGLKQARPDGKDLNGQRRATLLLRKLLRLGLSRFEPDPLQAIEKAEAKAKAARVN
jgi:hypothetical protein